MAVCPFADQSRRYDRSYGGSYVSGFPARGVLHTTETTGLPSYAGGASAPHFTVDPKSGRIWQHYDTARPSRALKHPAGTVDTNNARAIQIEIIAYSDASIARSVGGLEITRLTAAQLAVVAKLMRWIETACGVRRASGLSFKAYPASAGVSNGVRMSTTAWRSFSGWCGHEHVPVNDHGDPSTIAITALLGQLIEEDPLAGYTLDQIADAVVKKLLAVKFEDPTNHRATPLSSVIGSTWAYAISAKQSADAVGKKVNDLTLGQLTGTANVTVNLTPTPTPEG